MEQPTAMQEQDETVDVAAIVETLRELARSLTLEQREAIVTPAGASS